MQTSNNIIFIISILFMSSFVHGQSCQFKGSASLFSKQNLESKRLGTFPEGTKLIVLKSKDQWVKVKVKNLEGWLQRVWLDCSFDEGSLVVGDIDIGGRDLDYIRIVGVNLGFFTQNLKISVDYGQKGKYHLIKDAEGRNKEFESMIEALNFLSKRGWELDQAYAINEPDGKGSVYHYLLKRRGL